MKRQTKSIVMNLLPGKLKQLSEFPKQAYCEGSRNIKESKVI